MGQNPKVEESEGRWVCWLAVRLPREHSTQCSPLFTLLNESRVRVEPLISCNGLVGAKRCVRACFQPHLVVALAIGRAFCVFVCFWRILAMLSISELLATGLPCPENLILASIYNNGRAYRTFFRNGSFLPQ